MTLESIAVIAVSLALNALMFVPTAIRAGDENLVNKGRNKSPSPNNLDATIRDPHPKTL